MRLSKFLAQAGVASRRHADEMIEQGRVTVNGQIASLGQKVSIGKDRVLVDGKQIARKEPHVYVMLHKPKGYLSSCSDPFGRQIVLSLVSKIRQRIFPVGRLDQDAEGLLILTNDGTLAYLLTHPKHNVIKEYMVDVSGVRDNGRLSRLLAGIVVEGKKVKADYAKFLDSPGSTLKLLIGVHEGQKHLVKQLCESIGYRVNRLIRTKMGPLVLWGLPEGKWRYLTHKEVEDLYNAAQVGWEGEHNARKKQNNVSCSYRR